MCVPDTLGTYTWLTVVAVWAVQEATLEGLMSPIETYSCDLCVLDPVEDGLWVTCMTTSDWQQAQMEDPILGKVIVRMQDETLGQCLYKATDPPKLWQLLWECNHLKLRWGILYRKVWPREALFHLVLPTMQRETTLRECHDWISHLGLKQMFDLMCNHFF